MTIGTFQEDIFVIALTPVYLGAFNIQLTNSYGRYLKLISHDFKDPVVFGAKFFPHSFIFLEKCSIVKMLGKLKDGDSRPIKIVCKAKGRMVIQLEYLKIQSPFSF